MKRHWLLKLQFTPFLLNYIQVLLPLIYSSAFLQGPLYVCECLLAIGSTNATLRCERETQT